MPLVTFKVESYLPDVIVVETGSEETRCFPVQV